jgi:hypothetical protein
MVSNSDQLRAARGYSSDSSSSPLAREAPCNAEQLSTTVLSSPRSRGCSRGHDVYHVWLDVLPARAGGAPRLRAYHEWEPASSPYAQACSLSSTRDHRVAEIAVPHAWGCSRGER